MAGLVVDQRVDGLGSRSVSEDLRRNERKNAREVGVGSAGAAGARAARNTAETVVVAIAAAAAIARRTPATNADARHAGAEALRTVSLVLPQAETESVEDIG